MSRRKRWPAKALNLLIALAMVISLCVVFAPSVAAQLPDDTCDPVEQGNGCKLEVSSTSTPKTPTAISPLCHW
jgi:hypothetical protein